MFTLKGQPYAIVRPGGGASSEVVAVWPERLSQEELTINPETFITAETPVMVYIYDRLERQLFAFTYTAVQGRSLASYVRCGFDLAAFRSGGGSITPLSIGMCNDSACVLASSGGCLSVYLYRMRASLPGLYDLLPRAVLGPIPHHERITFCRVLASEYGAYLALVSDSVLRIYKIDTSRVDEPVLPEIPALSRSLRGLPDESRNRFSLVAEVEEFTPVTAAFKCARQTWLIFHQGGVLAFDTLSGHGFDISTNFYDACDFSKGCTLVDSFLCFASGRRVTLLPTILTYLSSFEGSISSQPGGYSSEMTDRLQGALDCLVSGTRAEESFRPVAEARETVTPGALVSSVGPSEQWTAPLGGGAAASAGFAGLAGLAGLTGLTRFSGSAGAAEDSVAPTASTASASAPAASQAPSASAASAAATDATAPAKPEDRPAAAPDPSAVSASSASSAPSAPLAPPGPAEVLAASLASGVPISSFQQPPFQAPSGAVGAGSSGVGLSLALSRPPPRTLPPSASSVLQGPMVSMPLVQYQNLLWRIESLEQAVFSTSRPYDSARRSHAGSTRQRSGNQSVVEEAASEGQADGHADGRARDPAEQAGADESEGPRESGSMLSVSSTAPFTPAPLDAMESIRGISASLNALTAALKSFLYARDAVEDIPRVGVFHAFTSHLLEFIRQQDDFAKETDIMLHNSKRDLNGVLRQLSSTNYAQAIEEANKKYNQRFDDLQEHTNAAIGELANLLKARMDELDDLQMRVDALALQPSPSDESWLAESSRLGQAEPAGPPDQGK